MGQRLDQLKRVWKFDKKLRKVGIRTGAYVTMFYRCRVMSHLPWLLSTRTTNLRFTDGLGGSKSACVKIRIDQGGGDVSILAGLLGDLEYWDPVLLPARRFLDLGANIGLTAVWVSLASPGIELACVEPDPRNIPLLKENLALNGLQSRVFACAVDATAGEAQLGIGSHTACSSLTATRLHANPDAVTVPVLTVPDILDQLNWDWVDLVKMDIEGAERNLLKSCASWIGRVGRIVLEIHPVTSAEEIEAFLRPVNFILRRIPHATDPTYLIERAA